MLNKVSMKKDADPATLFEQLASIENRYNTVTNKILEEDLVAIVLDAAPMEYQAVLTSEQRARGTLLMLDDLETAMNQHWRQIQNNKGARDDHGTDIALSATDANIFCFKCGEKGHKATNCPKNKSKGTFTSGGTGRTAKHKNGSDKRKCFLCQKTGHIAKDCWEDGKNANKRPANWKPISDRGGEQGNVGVQGSNGIEFLLCQVCTTTHDCDDVLVEVQQQALECRELGHSAKVCRESFSGKGKTKDRQVTEFQLVCNKMSFPASVDLLRNPNVFIADTGATVHSTSSDLGLIEVRKRNSSDTVTMGNGGQVTD
jgi:hypothetical protein